MNRDELQPMTPLPEREANRQAYGPVLGNILNELLGLVLVQAREWRTDGEVQVFAREIFESYVREHLPRISAQAAGYFQERQAREHELQRVSAQHEYARQERLQREAEDREKAKAETEATAYQKAQAQNLAAQEELSRLRAEEDRALQQRLG